MHVDITKLCNIAAKKSRLIIGLMSGTSLDGLDIALCHITGSGKTTEATILEFETIAYKEDFKTEIRKVFSKELVPLQLLCVLNPYIANVHAQMVLEALKKWNINAADVDLIASHGQTIYHAPKHLHNLPGYPNATLQIGDGDHLAVATGIITLSDFRQKHIAAGGEGAPLAPVADELLFSDATENRLLLNIGGIGNFTFLSAGGEQNISADTGPGNTLIDAFVQENFRGKNYDEDGDIGRSGKLIEPLLKCLKQHIYFKQPVPKTTGPEMFNLAYVQACISKSCSEHEPAQNILATLTHFSADTICDEINLQTKGLACHVYASGGGIHNAFLMELISKKMPWHIYHTTNALNILPDAKEAVVFAVLANECVAGNFERGKVKKVAMGKISLPG